MSSIKLLEVHYLPKELEVGILYVSIEFGVAGHLCACGCGNKIITPLGETEWSFKNENDKPTLFPSIGNWQLPCKAHYWIERGKIHWSYQFTNEEIIAGNINEELKRKKYYDNLNNKGFISRIKKWFIDKLRTLL